jgi:hypothetical protein
MVPAAASVARVGGFTPPGSERTRMIYYSDAGPGPATKLLRVDADDQGVAWFSARGSRWYPAHGWLPWRAQAEILHSGDFGLIDAAEVPAVQQQIRDRHEHYAALQRD